MKRWKIAVERFAEGEGEVRFSQGIIIGSDTF